MGQYQTALALSMVEKTLRKSAEITGQAQDRCQGNDGEAGAHMILRTPTSAVIHEVNIYSSPWFYPG